MAQALRGGEEAAPHPQAPPEHKMAAERSRGCGCATTTPTGDLSFVLLLGLAVLGLVRRRAP